MRDSARPGRPPGIEAVENGLTKRQQRILDCIVDSVALRGYPPTIREIGTAVGLNSPSSVSHHLVSLERKGYLSHDPRSARTYALAPGAQHLVDRQRASAALSDERLEARAAEAAAEAAVVRVPLLGRIAAGTPLLADQDVRDLLPMPRKVVGDGHLFALTVVGQSMIDAGIREGDTVTVRRQATAKSGDIVVALLADEEATVKKLKISGSEAWLMPCNLAYQPLRLGNDDRILGRVVSVMRSL
ncbi:transcriptional repressor LexA [Streptomyces goshikiensis]|uniref:transcriptional repressor LexA n=1 Tax=Streptomyces goshikiensis TaxID=1942 RepID=UPI00369F53C8